MKRSTSARFLCAVAAFDMTAAMFSAVVSLANFSVKNIGFGAHQASVEWAAIPGQDSRYTFDFLTAAAPEEPTVPAPMPLVLFALGLGAITYTRVPKYSAQKR
jgi:hypothetical protein